MAGSLSESKVFTERQGIHSCLANATFLAQYPIAPSLLYANRWLGRMTRAMTWWVWASLLLLFGLAGCVLYQWFFVIQQSAYPIDYFASISAARHRAHIARLGIGILLPLAVVT